MIMIFLCYFGGGTIIHGPPWNRHMLQTIFEGENTPPWKCGLGVGYCKRMWTWYKKIKNYRSGCCVQIDGNGEQQPREWRLQCYQFQISHYKIQYFDKWVLCARLMYNQMQMGK